MTMVSFVQLPFPSQYQPEVVQWYNKYYFQRMRHLFLSYYKLPAGYWELPLWVAIIDGIVVQTHHTSQFIDLSLSDFTPDLSDNVISLTQPGDVVAFSPLTQNAHLAAALCSRLVLAGRRPVCGGSSLAFIPATYRSTRQQFAGMLGTCDRNVATYRLFNGWAPPLVRLDTSYGCDHGCSFCEYGRSDVRTIQRPLHEVEAELESIHHYLDVEVVYLGNKTFGQGNEWNLVPLLENLPYQLIVQTTATQVLRPDFIDLCEALNVGAVEIGAETFHEDILKANCKPHRTKHVLTAIERLNRVNLPVILNLLIGLPQETTSSYAQTLALMKELSISNQVFWWNVYAFVPYPECEYFTSGDLEILDYQLTHWREDAPPIFKSTTDHYRFYLLVLDTLRHIYGPLEGVSFPSRQAISKPTATLMSA